MKGVSEEVLSFQNCHVGALNFNMGHYHQAPVTTVSKAEPFSCASLLCATQGVLVVLQVF